MLAWFLGTFSVTCFAWFLKTCEIDIFWSCVVKRDYFIIFLKTYGYNLSGKIVGVVLLNEISSLNSGRMLDVKFSARSSRWLEEVGSLDPTKMPEVRLVRRTLAWITGLILLISTLIGVRLPLLIGFTYFLCSSSDKVIKNALLFFGEHCKLSEFFKILGGDKKGNFRISCVQTVQAYITFHTKFLAKCLLLWKS